MRFFIVAILAILLMIACTSTEIGNSSDVNPETIYTEYVVNYDGGDSVGCFLQYRFAGENGTTLVLSNPSGVEIDGKALTVDSSTFSGAFYQKRFPVIGFEGTHTIKYTDINGQSIYTKFDFQKIEVIDTPGNIEKDDDFTLYINNITTQDVINICIRDTSATTSDLYLNLNPINDKVVISSSHLKLLKEGPCTVSVKRQIRKALDQATKQGGMITFNYFIKEWDVVLGTDKGM